MLVRFTAEEKEARNPYYYMPFGVGPRNCVGMRLALTELKMATVSILQTLKFVVCPETQVSPCHLCILFVGNCCSSTFLFQSVVIFTKIEIAMPALSLFLNRVLYSSKTKFIEISKR